MAKPPTKTQDQILTAGDQLGLKDLEPFQFKPGQSGNPNGAPKGTGELRKIWKLNRTECEKILNEILYMTMSELQEVIKDKNNNGIKVLMTSILIAGINEGDPRRADFFLDRLIGKVPNKIEGPNGEPMSFIGLVELATKPRDVEEIEDK